MKRYGYEKKTVNHINSSFCSFNRLKLLFRWYILHRRFDVVFNILTLPVTLSLFPLSLFFAFTCACLGYAYGGLAGAMLGLFGSFSWGWYLFIQNERRKWKINRKTDGRSDDRQFDRMEQLLRELRKTKRV